MYKRQVQDLGSAVPDHRRTEGLNRLERVVHRRRVRAGDCLLYTSDADDDLLCVDLGGRRIIKKKTSLPFLHHNNTKNSHI